MRAPYDPQVVAVAGTGPANHRPISLLLIEDDRADAVLVEELIADADADIQVIWAPSISSAEQELLITRPDCILVDLNLPDATGMDAVARIANRDATLPIVVLTGLDDEHFGVTAVASGAQDYLVKGRVEPDTLHRSLLYAIERKRSELTAVDLYTSQLRAQENARLERALLPSPLLADDPGCRSSPSTARAGRTRCSAATSTTWCRPPTAPCTSWWAMSRATDPTRPRWAPHSGSPGGH